MFVFSNTLQRGDMNIPLLNAGKIRLFSISISILGKQNKKGRLGKQCYTLLNIFTCYIKSCKIWKCMVNTLQFTWMNDNTCHHFVSRITTKKKQIPYFNVQLVKKVLVQNPNSHYGEYFIIAESLFHERSSIAKGFF